MNDTTKPAAQAVASAHKAPSRATIDTAQDELATLNYKLGRAQVAAMLSAGQAKADKAVLEELTALVEAKRLDLEALVEKFTNPPRPDQAAALEAIREKLSKVDQANGPGMPGDPIVASGGTVKPGLGYLVGEKGPELILGTPSKEKIPEGEIQAGTITLNHTITADQARRRRYATHRRDHTADADFSAADLDEIKGKGEYNVEDPESLNWGNEPAAMGKAVAGVVYATKTGEVVGEIRNAQPGDTLVGDGSELEALAVIKPSHRGKRPPNPPTSTSWTYPSSRGDVEMEFDELEGWTITVDAGADLAHTRRAVPEDLSTDYWEKGELAQIFAEARPKRSLFASRG